MGPASATTSRAASPRSRRRSRRPPRTMTARSSRSVWRSSRAALRSSASAVRPRSRGRRRRTALRTLFTPPVRQLRKVSSQAAALLCSGPKQRKALKNENDDVQAGINIVLKALEAPIRQIAENSSVEGSIVVGRITDNKSQTFGFDAQTEEYVDMLQAGIVDPAKVVRAALQNAASVAGLLVTTEAMISEAPKKESAPAMPGGGGMGGMDY